MQGAGRGICQAVALAFAKAGAKVAVVDLRLEGTVDTVRLCEEQKTTASGYGCDVSDERAVIKVIDDVRPKRAYPLRGLIRRQ